ncbi:MAG: hypothetical protein ACRCUS_03450 [Anaerovoracaceae bacterium]
MVKYFEKFAKLEMSYSEIADALGENFQCLVTDETFLINREIILSAFMKFCNNEVAETTLLDLVNAILFGDIFDLLDKDAECLASVLSRLEEIDEEGMELKEDEKIRIKEALLNNTEFYP